VKRLVLLGGGHAHVGVLRAFAQQPPAGCAVALVSLGDRQVYSGMVPGFVAGHYPFDECAIALAPLAQAAGASFRRAAASLVDPARGEVVLADGDTLAYDFLSLDMGSLPFVGDAVGVERHAVPVRPLEEGMRGWERVRARAAAGELAAITMVGGGAAGVELALAMDHRLKTDFGRAAPHLRVLTEAPKPLAELPAGAASRLERHLRERGIGVHCGARVREVGADFVRVEGGNEFATGATFWSAGGAPPGLVRDSGFATDARGYLLTNDFLQSVSHANVFGAGDCATQRGRERPKAGVFAVRAAPALAANLRAAIAGTPLAPHLTGKRYLALISTGSRHAVAAWGALSWEGDWVWTWKDRIDRKFVEGRT